MNYSVTTYEDDPHIILMTLFRDFRMDVDAEALVPELVAALETAPDKVVMLADDRDYAVKHVGEIMSIGALARHDDTKKLLNHPKLLKIITVTNDKALQLALKGINSATFGFIDITMCSTIEDGLNIARTMLYGQMKAN